MDTGWTQSTLYPAPGFVAVHCLPCSMFELWCSVCLVVIVGAEPRQKTRLLLTLRKISLRLTNDNADAAEQSIRSQLSRHSMGRISSKVRGVMLWIRAFVFGDKRPDGLERVASESFYRVTICSKSREQRSSIQQSMVLQPGPSSVEQRSLNRSERTLSPD